MLCQQNIDGNDDILVNLKSWLGYSYIHDSITETIKPYGIL